MLAIALCCALVALIPRLTAERNNKNYAFVTNYRDVAAMAFQSGVSFDAIWAKLSQHGVLGLTAVEYTGEEIGRLHPMGVEFSTVDDKAALLIPSDFKYTDKLFNYLSVKIPGTAKKAYNGKTVLLLPTTSENLFLASVLPDFDSFEYCKKNNIPLLYKLGTCTVSGGEDTAKALAYICNEYPQVKNIIPAGFIFAGNPDIKPITDIMKERGISLSQVEFVKQVGAGSAFVGAYPVLLPLHSFTIDEVISKNITRQATIERHIRAIHERSVRLILVHPFDLQMGDKLDALITDLTKTTEKLAALGYKAEWPEPYKPWGRNKLAILALALVFISTVWFYGARLFNVIEESADTKEMLTLFVIVLLYSVALWKVAFIAKLTGGICTGFVAAEAAICALQGKKYALPALFVIFTGGLSVAAYYGITKAALRILPFSGVKLTLLLPPLLVLYHDLKLRVHDETVNELVLRPAVWGELIIIGIMMLGMLIMALRSDNVSNVPAYELAFRDFLERTLVIRPRTKEIVIGYPSLVIYWYIVKHNYLPHYREVFRIAASLAFCSAMNTFCHFHTRLLLSVIRVVNGWWVGLLMGAVIVLLINTALKFLSKERTTA